MNIIDPGHIYDLWLIGTDQPQRLTFVKRSGGAIQYDHEYPGVQVQEVLRALIDRSEYLDAILPCFETQDAVWFLRRALHAYEARAYRRKQEAVNREQPAHDDTVREHRDVPFGEYQIEDHPIGDDGHIRIE